MSHDWFCRCGHDVYSHGSGKRDLCQFCNCRGYEQKPPPPQLDLERDRKAADILARFLEARGWSIFTSEDPEIIRLRGIENKVYAEHRDKDFTRARIESMKAVILAVLQGGVAE